MAGEVCLDRVEGLSQNPRLFEVARPEDRDEFESMVR
jgi:hypothetical protein